MNGDVVCGRRVKLPLMVADVERLIGYQLMQLQLVDDGRRSEPNWEQVYRRFVANLAVELNEAPLVDVVCPFDGDVDMLRGVWVCPVCGSEHVPEYEGE